MERYFKRADDIDQKIHSVKLPYLAWKVLFLTGDKQSLSNLKNLLEEDENEIVAALDALEKEGLIIAEEEAAAAPAEEKEPEVTIEEPVKEEPEPAKEEPVIEIAGEEEKPAAPEVPEEEPAEMPAEEEPAEEPIIFEGEAEEQPVATEEEPKVEETPEVEEKAEDISIDLSEQEKQEETAGLDLDFEKQPQEEPEAVTEAPAEPPAAKAEGEKTILVIDDSIVIRKMVELALENEDYVLETAVTGKDGLKALDIVKPDLVILDLMLPDINGIDLLKTIKASLGIPVIMLSGKDSPQMIEKAKAEGADAFLPKPFRDEDLVQNIKQLLNE